MPKNCSCGKNKASKIGEVCDNCGCLVVENFDSISKLTGISEDEGSIEPAIEQANAPVKALDDVADVYSAVGNGIERVGGFITRSSGYENPELVSILAKVKQHLDAAQLAISDAAELVDRA